MNGQAVTLSPGTRLVYDGEIDALPGPGKTTMANVFARAFDRAQIRRHGPVTGEGHASRCSAWG